MGIESGGKKAAVEGRRNRGQRRRGAAGLPPTTLRALLPTFLSPTHPPLQITTGSEQSITLTIDDAPYKLTMHELDGVDAAPPAPRRGAPPTPALAATLAAAAAVVAGRDDGAPAALPLSAAATVVGQDDAAVPAVGATPPPASPSALALTPFTLAGPLTLQLASVDSLRLMLPRSVEVPDAARVMLPAGVRVRVVGASTARLAAPLSLGAPPPAWLANAYGVPVDGVAPGAVDVPLAAGALAAAAGARAAAEGGAAPTVVLDMSAPGARLEVASLVDGVPPVPLKARLAQGGTVTLEPRVAEEGGEGGDAATDAAAPASPAWAWPLAGVTGSRLARADAALAELLAAARAARGGGGAGGAPPRLRLDGAGAEAVAFVRVRLDVTRAPLEGGDGANAVATLDASGPTTEQWDALVRVAPPASPGGPPRVAALRAEKVASSRGGGAAVTSVSIGPGAALAAVANATASPDDHDYAFVYPPSVFVL